MTIKILIAEDHDLTRQGISFGLRKYEDIEIVAEAVNGKQAIELAQKHKPDLILMDIIMPVMNGIEAAKELKNIDIKTKIIILTSHSEQGKVLSAFKSGVDGYCMKNIRINKLYNAINLVMDGIIWIDPAIAQYVYNLFQKQQNIPDTQKKDYNLTSREQEILELLAEGFNNKDIADKLCVSHYTVKNHVSSVINKLAVTDRTQAIVKALKEEIL